MLSLESWRLGPDAQGRILTLVRRPGPGGDLEYAIFRDDEADPNAAAELYGLPAKALVAIGAIAGRS